MPDAASDKRAAAVSAPAFAAPLHRQTKNRLRLKYARSGPASSGECRSGRVPCQRPACRDWANHAAEQVRFYSLSSSVLFGSVAELPRPHRLSHRLKIAYPFFRVPVQRLINRVFDANARGQSTFHKSARARHRANRATFAEGCPPGRWRLAVHITMIGKSRPCRRDNEQVPALESHCPNIRLNVNELGMSPE